MYFIKDRDILTTSALFRCFYVNYLEKDRFSDSENDIWVIMTEKVFEKLEKWAMIVDGGWTGRSIFLRFRLDPTNLK